MHPQIRAALAVLAGVIAGGVAIAVIEMLSPYHPPAGICLTDKEAFGAWVATLPARAFVLLLLAYFVGSAIGGYVTNWVAQTTPYRPALFTGLVLFVVGLMHLVTVPHPVWFAVVSSLLYFAGAWVGGRTFGVVG
ncbi:MAG: hypothetical protein SFV52_01255 [Saprospiraceae bacterium]|nr:hypothetical protein [Saprospiraceae bacterium]